jgi:AcrR family transcriptional regulator
MPPADLLEGDPETTQDAILQATYRALCEHGYADLTIQRIGDEFEKSKSLLYHHYDGKDELLLEFLAVLLDRLESDVAAAECADPAAHLAAVLDHGLAATVDADTEQLERAVTQLRARATHDEDYRDHFARSDAFLRDHVADIVRAGVADGSFAAADPERVADLVLVVLEGARNLRSTGEADALPGAREEMRGYVRRRLAGGDDG